MSVSHIFKKSKPVNTSLVPKAQSGGGSVSCGVSRESNAPRFIHKARQHEHGEKRSADTGAEGGGREKKERHREKIESKQEKRRERQRERKRDAAEVRGCR